MKMRSKRAWQLKKKAFLASVKSTSKFSPSLLLELKRHLALLGLTFRADALNVEKSPLLYLVSLTSRLIRNLKFRRPKSYQKYVFIENMRTAPDKMDRIFLKSVEQPFWIRKCDLTHLCQVETILDTIAD